MSVLTAARPHRATARPILQLVVPAGLVVLAAFAMTACASTNSDVSWLLTLGERWLDGQRPYVDFIEVNPPASILMYLPAVALARILGITPETTTNLLTIASAILSVGLSGHVLVRAGLVAPRHRKAAAIAALVLVLIVPTGDFAERDVLALLATLPMLAVLASRRERVEPTLAAALLAGLGGGIAMAIKPMFALGFVGPIGLLLLSPGWRRAIGAWEIYVAGAVAGLYGACVLLLFPDFTREVLGWVLLVYVPVRLPLMELLASPATLVWMGLSVALVMLMARGRRNGGAIVLALSSVGFEAVFLLQGKNWTYQALPAILLAALALTLQLAETWDDTPPLEPRRLAIIVVAAGLCVKAALLAAPVDIESISPGLTAAIERVAPHPRLLAITSDIAVGHPLVRDIGGRWIGTLCANWMAENIDRQLVAGVAPDLRDRLLALRERERAIVTSDIVAQKPDVILVQAGWWGRYIAPSPALLATFTDYRLVGTYGPLALWRRTPA